MTRILRTTISMSRVTKQYEEAMNLNIDVEDLEKYEYKFEPFNLLLDKIGGYMPNNERTNETGVECTSVFLDSDYLVLGISTEKFEKALLGKEGLSTKQI